MNYSKFKALFLELTVRVENNPRAIWWCLTKKKRFFKRLKSECDIVNMRCLSVSKWHMGCQYFTGVMQSGAENEQKVFIKTGGYCRVEQAEVEALLVLEEIYKSKCFFPLVVTYSYQSSNPFVAIRFLEGITLDNLMNGSAITDVLFCDTVKEKLIKELLEIADLLFKAQVVHRDIRPANIMVNLNADAPANYLTLFDFGYAIFPERQESINKKCEDRSLLAGLGEEYKPELFVWDDTYSLFMIAKKIAGGAHNKALSKLFNEYKRRIGRLEYRV